MTTPSMRKTSTDALLERSASPADSAIDYKTTARDSRHVEALDNSKASVEDLILPETSVVGRNIGWTSAYILIISRVIGSGIFATPGPIFRSLGSIGLTLVVWVAGAIISYFGLQSTLEYGCMLPRSGGDKVYLEFAYRRPRFLATILVAVTTLLLGFTASNCIVFAEYVLFAAGHQPDPILVKAIAAALLTGIIVMHSCFLKTGIWIQNLLGYVKIGLIIFMILAAPFALLFHQRSEAMELSTPSTTNPWSNIWEGSVWAWGTIATALFKVFYSFAGLHNVNNVMNEVKNPVRTLKSAATTALWTACVLYLFVNLAYFAVVPLDEIKDSGELIAALFFQRLFGTHVGRILLPLAVAISAAGNVMVVTFSHARIIQELARSGVLPPPLPRWLSSTKPFGAPAAALVAHFIPSFLVITIPTGAIYSFILDVEGYPSQFFTIAGSAGLLWLRYKRPDLRRPYKAFLPAVWFRIAFATALLAAPFVPQKGVTLRQHLANVSYAFVGTTILLFGVLYWYAFTVWLPRRHGYIIEEVEETLDDGTTITKLVRVPIDVKADITDYSGER